jgi:eukaryotic-like serine/threonine-protein kinase
MRAEPETGPLALGQMLDDKYRIDELLEVGGMGAVYVGSHTRLQKRVAIKVLRSELTEATEMVERFLREAVAASRIGHENIVEVNDIGKAPNGSPFIVMELLEGENLAARIRRVGPMPLPQACHIAIEILSAMDAAHRAGIVHRDLKPENVFLARQSRAETVKVLDFGISRMVHAEEGDGRLTLTGLVMGTPYYMSPEQACGEPDITAAADIYAAGVILYEMLTAKVPFEATNYNSLIYKVMSGQFPPARTYVPLPEPLEQIIHRAMALKPADRFSSAMEMMQLLEQFAPPSPSQPFALLPWSPSPAAGFQPVIAAPATMPSAAPPPPRPGAREEAYASTVADSGPVPKQALERGPMERGPMERGPVERGPVERGAMERPLGRPGAAEVLTRPPEPPQRRSRGAVAAIAAVVVLGGAAAALFVLQNTGGGEEPTASKPAASGTDPAPSSAPAPTAPETTPPAPTAPETTSPATTPPATPPATTPSQAQAQAASDDSTEPSEAADQVTLSFVVTPADAVIRANGKPIGDRRLTAARSSPAVEIEVSRPGYIPKRRVVAFESDREIEIILERVRRPRRPRERAPAPQQTERKPPKRIITDSPYD